MRLVQIALAMLVVVGLLMNRSPNLEKKPFQYQSSPAIVVVLLNEYAYTVLFSATSKAILLTSREIRRIVHLHVFDMVRDLSFYIIREGSMTSVLIGRK